MSTHANNTPITAPTFQNSWANLTGFTAAGYWKDTLGIVHLRGMVTGGNVSVAMFTLPAGFRPEGKERFLVAAYPGEIAGLSAVLTIPALGVIATGTDPQGGTVTVGGSTAATDITPVAPARTWLDVLTDGTVVPFQDALTDGYFVSLAGVQFFAEA